MREIIVQILQIAIPFIIGCVFGVVFCCYYDVEIKDEE